MEFVELRGLRNPRDIEARGGGEWRRKKIRPRFQLLPECGSAGAECMTMDDDHEVVATRIPE